MPRYVSVASNAKPIKLTAATTCYRTFLVMFVDVKNGESEGAEGGGAEINPSVDYFCCIQFSVKHQQNHVLIFV